ncbi:putative diguanylate cyclase YedQ [compost metagenome]
MLATLADILKKQFRSKDHIARKGGEEFIVIVNRRNVTEVQAIAEQLRYSVEKYKFILPDNTTTHITISIGIASYPEVEPDNLVDTADQALYLAKQSGRNTVCLFSDLQERR